MHENPIPPKKRAPRKKTVAPPALTPEPEVEEIPPVAEKVESPIVPEKKLILNKAAYDQFNRAARLILPALGALYASLGALWGLPKVNEVLGTIVALNVFLGVVVTISSNRWNNSNAKYDGEMVVEELNDGKKMVSFEIPGDPQEILDKKDEVTFKVNKQ